MNLTEQQITEMYDLLGKLVVEIKDRPDMGMAYVRERLTLCRAMQDQLQDMRLKVGRALSWVTEQLIFSKHTLPLAGSDQEREQTKIKIGELDVLFRSHTMLWRLVQATASSLNGTNRDIRLLGDVIKQQLRLGEINPHETGEGGADLLQPVDLADMGTAPTPPAPAEPPEQAVVDYFRTSDQMQAAARPTRVDPVQADGLFAPTVFSPPTAVEVAVDVDSPGGFGPDGPRVMPSIFTMDVQGTAPAAPAGGAFDELFAPASSSKVNGHAAAPVTSATPTAPVVRAGVETVSFDTPLPAAVTAPRGIQIADHSAVPIESLLEETDDGQTTPVNPAL